MWECEACVCEGVGGVATVCIDPGYGGFGVLGVVGMGGV